MSSGDATASPLQNCAREAIALRLVEFFAEGILFLKFAVGDLLFERLKIVSAGCGVSLELQRNPDDWPCFTSFASPCSTSPNWPPT
jgi:hypothetical protein